MVSVVGAAVDSGVVVTVTLCFFLCVSCGPACSHLHCFLCCSGSHILNVGNVNSWRHLVPCNSKSAFMLTAINGASFENV